MACKYVYSRGNNDENELKRQKKLSDKASADGKYVYETAQFELLFTSDPHCGCKESRCEGDIDLHLQVRVKPKSMPDGFQNDFSQYWDTAMQDMVLLCGPPPGKPGLNAAAAKPGPFLKRVDFFKVDLPAAQPGNKFKKWATPTSPAQPAKFPTKLAYT